jgi:hypothetical protein
LVVSSKQKSIVDSKIQALALSLSLLLIHTKKHQSKIKNQYPLIHLIARATSRVDNWQRKPNRLAAGGPPTRRTCRAVDTRRGRSTRGSSRSLPLGAWPRSAATHPRGSPELLKDRSSDQKGG